MAHSISPQTDTIGTVLAHSSSHTLGLVYVSMTIAVQCYIFFLMWYRNRRDTKRGQALNPTRVTILIVTGFLGVMGWALLLDYRVNYWLLIGNSILGLVTWSYAIVVKRRIKA
jgi:uncharacterized membrane protein